MKQRKTLRWLWQVTGRKKGYILALTLIQAVSGGLGVVYALLFRTVVDSAVEKNETIFRHYVMLVIGLVLFQIAISAVTQWLHELARADLENSLKQRLTDRLLQKDYASVAATHTAEWMNRLSGDTSVVAGGAVDILPGLVRTLVGMISALVIIIAIDAWFAWILIPGGCLLIVFTFAFRGVLKRLHKDIRERDGRLRIFLHERLSNLMTIKAFTAEKQTEEGAVEAMAEHKAARMRRVRFSTVARIGMSGVMRGMYLIGVVYCAHGIMTGRVSYGTLTAVMQLIGQVQRPFSNLSGYMPRWYAMIASAERLMEPEDYPEDEEQKKPEEISRLYEGLRSFGFRHARFTYQTGEKPVVLEDFSLDIRRGETIAFTGTSGCGKSTVLKLLMGMYPLDQGERYLNTADGTVSLTGAYRRLFAWVPQGNALMNGTIREVVSFAKPEWAGEEGKIRQALKTACADEFVNDVDQELGEGGSGLSEGQMQRIAIARAIFSEAPILLLDEATSALDEETEGKLLENLRTLENRTVIIVTHRKAVFSICDRVLTFEEQGVTEV